MLKPGNERLHLLREHKLGLKPEKEPYVKSKEVEFKVEGTTCTQGSEAGKCLVCPRS